MIPNVDNNRDHHCSPCNRLIPDLNSQFGILHQNRNSHKQVCVPATAQGIVIRPDAVITMCFEPEGHDKSIATYSKVSKTTVPLVPKLTHWSTPFVYRTLPLLPSNKLALPVMIPPYEPCSLSVVISPMRKIKSATPNILQWNSLGPQSHLSSITFEKKSITWNLYKMRVAHIFNI